MALATAIEGRCDALFIGRAMIAMACGLLCASPVRAQTSYGPYQPTTQPPAAKRAAHVEIRQGPALELAHDDVAVIRWTIDNPGGSDEHFAIVHYGTDPNKLSGTATSHIRLNRDHAETILRVRLEGLQPLTTYYYRVTSAGSDGVGDGEQSSTERFTTPGPGQRSVAFPPPN